MTTPTPPLPAKTTDAATPAGRLRIRELEDALTSLDEPLAWIAENYPAVMREMPTDYWRALKYAAKVLTRGS